MQDGTEKEDVTFMLKTKRLEYTFEFFRGKLAAQLRDPSRLSIKERADQNYISELRFLTTRMVSLSYLVGLNIAAFSYFAAFRHLRLYLCIPLTVTAFSLGRNLSMKGSISRLYAPIEPLYKDVRRH